MGVFGAHPGEFLSLLTAACWAVAVILFKRSGETVHPVGLNVFKNLLALALFIPTLWLMVGTLTPAATTKDYLLLLSSGALGIGIADTLFFKSLNLLGAGLTAIVSCTYPLFVIGFSMLWLDESLSAGQVIGAAMIISAVLTITRAASSHPAHWRTTLWGVALGALSHALSALGIVMFKPILDHSPVLWVTVVRLLGGMVVLAAVLAFHRSRRAIVRSVLSADRRWFTISSSLVGTYLAMMLWLAGMKYTHASVAAALNQTSNLFIFIMAAVFLGERLTPLRAAGIVLGVAGALLVTFT